SRKNPFGDIKSDGTVKTALENLGLGEAAKRDVGTGENQIPDMASFASGDGWMKLPNGKILQYGRGRVSPTLASQTLRVEFNIPFPKKADIALLSHSGDGGSTAGSGRGFMMTTEEPGLTGFYSAFRTTSTSPTVTMNYCWWAVGE
ncbi:gp53-like domain-containing protein, partial [Escherichia coli]